MMSDHTDDDSGLIGILRNCACRGYHGIDPKCPETMDIGKIIRDAYEIGKIDQVGILVRQLAFRVRHLERQLSNLTA